MNTIDFYPPAALAASPWRGQGGQYNSGRSRSAKRQKPSGTFFVPRGLFCDWLWLDSAFKWPARGKIGKPARNFRSKRASCDTV